ncbi:MAG: exodeoxyribonuclease VII small subunit [Candidatus Aquicultorales bacterium]
MTEETTFETARVRIDEIVARVKDKDTPLDEAIDLLEEGVRLANICTERLADEAGGASDEAPADDVRSEECGAVGGDPE